MSGGKQSQAKPCPPDCRFRDSQGYCDYRQVMGRCRSLIEGAEHPGPDCSCYEPADGQPKPKDLPRLARREAAGYTHRPTARQSLENDRKALELYQRGATDPEIARATGWAKSTVGKWRRDNGLPCNRTATPLMDREADAVRLYGQGLSDGAIARSIGCSQVAVYHWRKRTGRAANHKSGRKRKGENNYDQSKKEDKQSPCCATDRTSRSM